jgi:hypothetical protein
MGVEQGAFCRVPVIRESVREGRRYKEAGEE